jgi:hypothetical protein
MSTADFRVDNHGTVVLFTPLTEAAQTWAAANLPSDTAMFAGSLAIESRCIDVILDAAESDGLIVGGH